MVDILENPNNIAKDGITIWIQKLVEELGIAMKIFNYYNYHFLRDLNGLRFPLF